MQANRFITMAAAAAAALFVSSPASADIVLSPGTAGVIAANLGPANCEPACVETAFSLAAGTLDTLLYKSDEDGAASGLGSDSGSFASAYMTTFDNTPTDPADALIEYITGQTTISCADGCYLAIKDGNQDPSYYFYDLSAWNGTESISLEGFWPQRGAISHVSIWSGADGSPPPNEIPEPAGLALVGLGLIGVAATRRRRKA